MILKENTKLIYNKNNNLDILYFPEPSEELKPLWSVHSDVRTKQFDIVLFSCKGGESNIENIINILKCGLYYVYRIWQYKEYLYILTLSYDEKFNLVYFIQKPVYIFIPNLYSKSIIINYDNKRTNRITKINRSRRKRLGFTFRYGSTK